MECTWAILSSVACPALQYFSTLSHKQHDFRKQVIEHKMCVSSLSTPFVSNIFHFKKKWARYPVWSKMYIGLHLKYLLFLSDCNENLIFSADFRKILKYQISRKSVQWKPSCSLQRDGQTRRANSRLSQFAYAHKNAQKI